jgi:molecular chaperone HtpG
MTTSLQKTRVDLAGLMRVLGEALYSTPHVAIRELVQNAHDSCVRRRIEDTAPFEPAISVTSTPGTLVITDNGAGLTVDEIHSYLATVGAGYTRTLRDAGRGDGLIGYFGLGFLSAFAVSDRIEVWTCSYQDPEHAYRFTSRSGETYTVEAAERRPVGTEVRLSLREEATGLEDADVVRGRLRQYCCLLEHPVSFNGGSVVNADRPPWRTGADVSPLRLKTLSLEFARRFESTFDPIVTIPLPSGDHGLAGLLWIQDGGSYATSDNRNVSVFVRGMLISDDERDLLPRWAGFVGGVIESRKLQPTASRESLVKDEAYRAHAQAIRERLIEGLSQLATTEPATWRRVLLRHNEALLGAALVDDRLFALVADDVTVPTTEGDLTLPALLERANGRIHVTQGDRAGVESLLLRALKQPVVLGSRFGASAFCLRYTRERRGDLVMLGTEAGDGRLFQAANLDAAAAAQIAAWFSAPDREVLVRSFEPTYLPFALVIDRDAELKRSLESDDADRRIGQAVLGLARQFTHRIKSTKLTRMYVNAGNPVIRALIECDEPRRRRALGLLEPLAELLGGTQGGAGLEQALRSFEASILDVAGSP